jgi:hypothetical protein
MDRDSRDREHVAYVALRRERIQDSEHALLFGKGVGTFTMSYDIRVIVHVRMTPPVGYPE